MKSYDTELYLQSWSSLPKNWSQTTRVWKGVALKRAALLFAWLDSSFWWCDFCVIWWFYPIYVNTDDTIIYCWDNRGRQVFFPKYPLGEWKGKRNLVIKRHCGHENGHSHLFQPGSSQAKEGLIQVCPYLNSVPCLQVNPKLE